MHALGYAGLALVIWAFVTFHDPCPDVFLPVRLTLLAIMIPGLLRVTLSVLLAPWQRLLLARKDRRLDQLGSTPLPLVSVIIPAWNEEVGARAAGPVGDLLVHDRIRHRRP